MTESSDMTQDSELLTEVKKLTEAVTALTAKFRINRWANIVLTLVVAAIVLLGTLYYLDVLNRRKDAAANTRALACTIVAYFPPGPQLIDDLRMKYNCPKYKAPGAIPTPTRTP